MAQWYALTCSPPPPPSPHALRLPLRIGLLAFRAFPFDKVINRRVRYIWHSAGIAFMVTGLIAVFTYHNDRNKANLWSIHSWMGLMTVSLYLAQYVLGGYLFFYEQADPDMREAYIPFFAWLDIFVYMSACFTAEMGIVEKNTDLGCTYNVTEIKNYNNADPAIYYDDLPAGCRISSGLGVVILFLCMCTVYAAMELKLPDLSNTAAGWEAYKLTEEEQRRRGTWMDWLWSFWPFGKKKRNLRNKAKGGEGKSLTRSGKKKSNWIAKDDGDGKRPAQTSQLGRVGGSPMPGFPSSNLPFVLLVAGVYYYNTKTNESTKVRPADF